MGLDPLAAALIAVEENVDLLKGPEGKAGVDGAQGPRGFPGEQGPKGDEGPQGPAGQDGTDGTDGKDGRDGSDGESIRWRGKWSARSVYAAQDAVEFEGSSYIARARTRTKPPKGCVTLMAKLGDSGTVLLARPGGGGAGTAAAGGGVGLSLSGNTAGALGLISSGIAILAGGNNITLSQNGQSITISGANAGGAQTGISGLPHTRGPSP